MNQAFSGLLLFNKSPGLTSFKSLDIVKKVFKTKKVGHTGTLDKFASGLLLILIGKAVKLSPLFLKHCKEYIGELSFGAETDTLDPEGSIIARGDIPTLKDVENALQKFRGNIMQLPPSYSALHVNGKRAYQIAREGKEPELEKRAVTIHNLEILSYEAPLLKIRALVSSGTYIRSLARDIAIEAGSRAHLSSLTRIGIDDFSLDHAIDDNTLINSDFNELGKYICPLNSGLFTKLKIPQLFVNNKNGFFHGAALEKLFSNGELNGEELIGHTVAAVFPQGDENYFLGYIVKNNDKWSYGHVFTAN